MATTLPIEETLEGPALGCGRTSPHAPLTNGHGLVEAMAVLLHLEIRAGQGTVIMRVMKPGSAARWGLGSEAREQA